MGRRTIRGVAAAAVLALALAAVSGALAARSVTEVHLQVGNIVVDGEGGFAPMALPKNVDAPITIFGQGKIGTADGTFPPVLKTIEFEFDKHGSVDTTGLAKCSAGKLQATTVPQARKLCPGAIVGTGRGSAVVKFPEQAPIPASSAITLFNGPRKGGDPTFYAHAHITVPAPTTFIVPVRIETIHNGRYGYRVKAEIPKNRRRLRHPPLRLDPGRTQMDLQGQEAQLRQRPLRRRPLPGGGQIRLQRRHPPGGNLRRSLQEPWLRAAAESQAPAEPTRPSSGSRSPQLPRDA